MSVPPDSPGDNKEALSPREIQEELGIPNPAPIARQVSRPPTGPTVNTQYNFNVSLPTVQLPSWEELSKYPQDIREFLMRAGEKEQDARHTWAANEQVHRHQYDHARLAGTFDRQRLGQILAASVSFVCVTAGTAIIIAGGNPWGFAAILGGITPLVAMAAWARNVSPPKTGDESQESPRPIDHDVGHP